MLHRVLIIGSSGMLGVDLCQELSGKYYVVGADIVENPESGTSGFVKVDITDKGSVERLFAQARPEAVVLTAAWTDVDGCELDRKRAFKINADGPKNVAMSCKKAGIPLIYISTDFIFNGRKRGLYKESDSPEPLSAYGASKLGGEVAVRKVLKKCFILRTSWLYGRHGKNFVDTIIRKGKDGEDLKVVDDQVGSPTYTKDLSGAIRSLLGRIFSQYAVRNTQYGIYHVSNVGHVSWYLYAKKILNISGVRSEVKPIGSDELGRPAERPTMSAMDTSKFRIFTGHKMRGWGIALKSYIRDRKVGRK